MKFCGFLLLTVLFTECYASYKTHYVEDYCKSGTMRMKYQVDSYQSESSAILQGKRKKSSPVSHNCTIVLSPPKGYGINIAMRKIDFSKDRVYHSCENYIKIIYSPLYEPVTFCEYSFLKSKTQFSTREGELKIIYHTVKNEANDTKGRSDFQLTFTAYTKDAKHCDSKDAFLCFNGNCIWNGLICDGIDNCGDESDEGNLVCDSHAVAVLLQMLYIIIACILTVITLVGITVCCCRYGKFRRPMVTPPNLTTSVTPYQAIHPSGCFICQDPAGPSDPCPLYHPHNLNGEGGFSNPCYPHGIPQHPFIPLYK